MERFVFLKYSLKIHNLMLIKKTKNRISPMIAKKPRAAMGLRALF